MFKVLGRIDLGRFLFKKPLRWIFVQTFGSKSKKWFDNNIEPIIDIALMHLNIDLSFETYEIVETEISQMLIEKLVAELQIPRQYESFAKEFVKEEVRKYIDSKLIVD